MSSKKPSTTKSPAPESSAPVEVAARLALDAATAALDAARAKQAAAAEAMASVDPLKFASAAEFATAADQARFDAAHADAAVVHAAARAEQAKAAHDAAHREQLVVDERNATVAANVVLAAFKDIVGTATVNIGKALELATAAMKDRDQLRDSLREQGIHPSSDARDSLASDLPGLLARGDLTQPTGIMLTAANIARWVEREPERLAETRANEEARARDMARARREAAMRGELGPEAEKEAEEEYRKAVAAAYGPSSLSFRLPRVSPEVALYREQNGIPANGEEL